MENLNPLVRVTWAKWGEKQPNPRPSRLAPGEGLKVGQKNTCRLAGEAIEEPAEQYSSCSNTADDLIGYTTLKLKVLQVAAQELLDVWAANGEGEYDKLTQAVGRLEDAMNRTGGRRRPEA